MTDPPLRALPPRTAIMLKLVFHAKETMQRELLAELYKPDMIEEMLKESDSVVQRRKECIKMVRRSFCPSARKFIAPVWVLTDTLRRFAGCGSQQGREHRRQRCVESSLFFLPSAMCALCFSLVPLAVHVNLLCHELSFLSLFFQHRGLERQFHGWLSYTPSLDPDQA